MGSRKVRTAERMESSRAKERKRNIEINSAFHQLQRSFNSLPWLQRKQKVPKVKMLRLACKYIEHLTMVLSDVVTQSPFSSPRLLQVDDFERVALEEMNQRNSYTKRLFEDENFARQEMEQRGFSSERSSDSPDVSQPITPQTSDPCQYPPSEPDPPSLPSIPFVFPRYQPHAPHNTPHYPPPFPAHNFVKHEPSSS